MKMGVKWVGQNVIFAMNVQIILYILCQVIRGIRQIVRMLLFFKVDLTTKKTYLSSILEEYLQSVMLYLFTLDTLQNDLTKLISA